MKRRVLSVLLCAGLVVSVLAGCGSDDAKKDSGKKAASESDLDYVKEKGTLVVGITNFEPMDYQDEEGEWIGFDADMAKAFGESLGVDVEFVEIDWDNKILELDGKTIDCVWNGMTLTEEVTSSMECTDAYLNNAQVVVLPADKADKYQDEKSLSDLSFAVESGSAGEDEVENRGLDFTPVTAQADALMEVAAGTSDAAVIDLLMATAMIGEGTNYADLAYTVRLSEEEYGVGFRKGSDLAKALNDFFAECYEDESIVKCAGGGFENICAAADIIKGHNIGSDAFTFSVYPASTPIYMELVKNGVVADLMEAGTVVKTAFCGPCFGAGDTPANNAFSIRHTTRNFPNREGSKLQSGQISSVALMDARSIAATAANKGYLTPATAFDVEYKGQKYHFDQNIYANRVFDSKGKADPNVEIQFGPNIKDWPEMSALPENLIVKVVSEIHDPVTTTDELIPSGETSSYRSNPLGLAEFALSRKDPAYVGRAKEVQKAQKAIEAGTCPLDALEELKPVMSKIQAAYPEVGEGNVGVGSTIFAVKPGDGSAREQAASCQKVLGGWANIAVEYATKRYRSNLINWGMLPFLTDADHEALPFKNGDYIFVPNVRKAVEEKKDVINAYVVGDELKEIQLKLGDLTDAERQIILDGCLINYYKATK